MSNMQFFSKKIGTFSETLKYVPYELSPKQSPITTIIWGVGAPEKQDFVGNVSQMATHPSGNFGSFPLAVSCTDETRI